MARPIPAPARPANSPVLTGAANIARHFGATRRAIDTWIAAGFPAAKNSVGAWQVNRAAAEAWVDEHRVKGSTTRPDLAVFELRKARADAVLSEAKALQALGQLVSMDVVFAEVERAMQAFRAKMLAAPAKLAPIVAAERDLAKCRKIIDAAMRDALDELSNLNLAGAPE